MCFNKELPRYRVLLQKSPERNEENHETLVRTGCFVVDIAWTSNLYPPSTGLLASNHRTTNLRGKCFTCQVTSADRFRCTFLSSCHGGTHAAGILSCVRLPLHLTRHLRVYNPTRILFWYAFQKEMHKQENSRVTALCHFVHRVFKPWICCPIRRFIAVFTTARHRSLSWGSWIQSTSSQPIFLILILIWTSDLRPGFPRYETLWLKQWENKNFGWFALIVPALYLND
jgi:hypothetical protein